MLACTTMEAAIASSLETLHNIIYRGCVPAQTGKTLLNTSLSLFKLAVAKVSTDSWLVSPPITLCGLILAFQNYTPYLTHKDCLPKGVKYLCHLFTEQGFKTFYQLRVDFDLPCTYPFYYYQLRHAVYAQFRPLDNPRHLLWSN